MHMPKIALTEARIKALKPRRNARDIRDTRLRGFGVRVLPSGRKYYFIQHQHLGERVWKIIGDAETVSVGEARALAAEMLAATRMRAWRSGRARRCSPSAGCSAIASRKRR